MRPASRAAGRLTSYELDELLGIKLRALQRWYAKNVRIAVILTELLLSADPILKIH